MRPRSPGVVLRRVPSLSEECALMHPLQGASFLSTPLQGGILKPPALRVVGDWLRVFRNPGASRTGHRRRQQQHTRAVWPEKCGGLRGTAWHKMQVITEFFGSGARAALPGHRAAFFSSFKELARCTKLATSYSAFLWPHRSRMLLLPSSVASTRSSWVAENAQPVIRYLTWRIAMAVPYSWL